MYANESPVRQTPNERISYSVVVTPWGETPTNISLAVYDVTIPGYPVVVTDTVTTGSNQGGTDTITSKFIGPLTLGNDYRADLIFTDSANDRHEVSWKILCRVS